ncbi:MAG: DUF4298 domain-containing protein [Campylobacteraceae bacterium]|nr:DUF4298 domain-containing protein [Campylobacteraceae bacterium]
MKDFSHITKFENILNTYGENLQELNKALNEIKELIPKYQSLIEYYYSEQRDKDLSADEKGEIPEKLNRGVLSEDAIYNTILDSQDTAIKMLEIAILMLKS